MKTSYLGRWSQFRGWLICISLVLPMLSGCRQEAQVQSEIRQSIERSFAAKQAPGQALVFVDLSDSLSDGERSLIPTLVGRVIEMQPSNTRVFVYLLDGEMENASPLQDILIPDREHATNQNSFDTVNDFEQAKQQLVSAVTDQINLRKGEKTRPFTSCYLNSLSFANGFFESHPAPTQHAVWVGDLIEDCKRDGFAKYNLARYSKSLHPDEVVAGYVSDLTLPVSKLQKASLTAVFVPRPRSDGRNPVPPAVVMQYWAAVAQKLDLGPRAMKFMYPPDIAEKR